MPNKHSDSITQLRKFLVISLDNKKKDDIEENEIKWKYLLQGIESAIYHLENIDD